MTIGISLTSSTGEVLKMPGWNLNLDTVPPSLFKDAHRIDLPWKALEMTLTHQQFAKIRAQYEATLAK